MLSNSPSAFGAMQVVQSDRCFTLEKKAEIVQCVPRKRRRNWRIIVTQVEEPTAYMLAGGTFVVHPAIYRELLLAGVINKEGMNVA